MILFHGSTRRIDAPRIVSLLAKTLDIPEPEALDLFYRSKTYQDLQSGENGLHNMGDLFVVDELLLELDRLPSPT